MATEPSEPDPFAAFGANEWLADEMYESYLSDPKSVDPAWIKYFESDSFKGNSPGDAKPVTSSPVDAPRPDAVSDNKTPEAPSRGTAAAAPASSQPAAAAAAAAPAPAAPAPAAPAQPVAAKAAQAPSPQTAASPQKAAPAGGGVPTGGTVNQPTSAKPAPAPTADSERKILRGAPARTAQNMETSLTVPTATSVREVPVKLLIDNRIVINNHLRRARGGKISFTHLVGWALVKALKTLPEMNASYDVTEGKPTLVQPAHINLGLAIDMAKPDGTRQLLVPSIKATESMTFAQFWMAYEDVVRRARDNKLALPDFQGTTISLTNPGTIGTQHSVPRLMSGQGCIVGVGAMDYPSAYQGAAEETMAKLAVSKVMTLTSTYDHRIIQGAQSGEFLRRLHRLLLGDEGFYDEIFQSLRIPYEPIRWSNDIATSHDDEISKQARILELIHAYRVRGHLMADTDPLEYRQRSHPDLEVESHGLTLWDLDREFATGSFGGEGRRFMKLRNILGILRDSYCRTMGIEYMHIQDPEQRRWIQERVEQPHVKPPREEQLR
ncbi:MAG: multifunctional 2-oxoglutarate metabolism enzyme, partial [Kribbellaceae bacterium]|nr:multifunctional 2-oxoglutarate metabolism enzyme [Kribbellaceae bacterium]